VSDAGGRRTCRPVARAATSVPAVPASSPQWPGNTGRLTGCAPMRQAGLIAHLFNGIVAFAERLNLKYSRLGNPCVYDNAVFPWVAGIEGEWCAVRAELERNSAPQGRVAQCTGHHHRRPLNHAGFWLEDIFVPWHYGIRSQRNIDLCPETWRIVRKIPGLKTGDVLRFRT